MFRPTLIISIGFAALVQVQAQSYRRSAKNLSARLEGQHGTNNCGTGSNQNSMCQNAYVNNVDDWCVWAPPAPHSGTIGDTERIEVAWCLQSGYGTRLIPDGTIHGAHFVVTPDFVQLTGIGDLTSLNIPAGGDGGGELDPHGADGQGNPIGGKVFSNAYGKLTEFKEWTNFVSNTQFCFRACKPGPKAWEWCQHIYDTMGCDWNMPGNYAPGVFEQCKGDSGEPMGVYGTSTFHQGESTTPEPHATPSSSECQKLGTIGNNVHFTVSAYTNKATSTKTTSITSTTTTVSSTTVTSGTTTVTSSSNSVTGTSKTGSSSSSSSTSSAPSTTTSNAAPSRQAHGASLMGAALLIGGAVLL